MSPTGKRKPYLEAWLKRTRRELSVSGRLSELAAILSAQGELDAVAWRSKLQGILEGEEEPGLELLTRIDTLLARRSVSRSPEETGGDLFG
jgi:hypothetical protein